MILMCKVSKKFANGHYEIEDFNEVESNRSNRSKAFTGMRRQI